MTDNKVTCLFDYIAWRGDLTVQQSPFNEIDGMILARFAYVPFEHFSQPLPGRFIAIKEIAGPALADKKLTAEERWKLRDNELLPALAASGRFGDLEIGFHGSVLDEVMQTQFSAITVRLDEDLHAIVFRGTDNTVIGWKEDLNMSFLCPVPGQRMAAEYVDRIAPKVGGRLILCGHSKGGNLAVYAGAFCGEEAQERIDAVYNYDGPGFFDDVIDSEGYQRIRERIHTYVPQSSVVGMLLGHPEGHTVVHSTESGLSQHDIYSWEVLGAGFVALETVTGSSRFVDATIKDWTKDMTPEQFEGFVDTVYTVLTDTQMSTMHEMKENWMGAAWSMVKSVAGMDEKTRAAAYEALKMLAKSAGREAMEAGKEAIGAGV